MLPPATEVAGFRTVNTMKLKRLAILGFKSFADKISLDFDCEIVGIVGPNGCGKSNIVDAFRWVLGEQSAKSLRGDKMHDVLFAGTDKRKPLNIAEVSVTLTEVNGALPIAYDEVTITRRLYRNDDSEYFINRQPVRLKDVHNLFLGSGIGKNTFSIFEQGKLDQVINLNPMERRGIFDEAAGIGRFLQRKKETIRKLTRVNENYNRVSDVHQEVEKQTKRLKKQAVQAKHLQEDQKRLEELERALLVTRWRTLFEKHHDLKKTLDNISEEVKEGHHRLAVAERRIEQTKKDLTEKQERTKTKQIYLHKAETEAHVQEAERRQQQRHLADFEKKKYELNVEKQTATQKRELLLKQIAENKKDLWASTEQKTVFEKSLEKEREAYEQSERQMSVLKKELKTARVEYLNSIHEEGRLQRELQEKKLNIYTDQQRLESLKQHIKEKKEEKTSLGKEVLEMQKEVKTLSKAIDQLESFEEAVQSIKKDVAENEKALQRLLKKMTELRAREQALLHFKEACEGFSSGAKRLLTKFKGRIRGLFEVLKPQEKIMPALQKYAQTLVVSTKKDLDHLLAFAKKNALSDFSVAVFNDEESFLHLKEESVTEEGFYIDQKGVVFHFNASHKEGNPFLREAELDALSKELFKRKKEQESLQKSFEKLLEKLNNCEEKQRRVVERRRKLEMSHVQENFSLQRALFDLEKCGRELIALESEQKKLKTLKKKVEDLKALEKSAFFQKKQCAALLKSLKKHEEGVEAKEGSLQIALKQWQEAQGVCQKALSRWQQHDQKVKILEASEEQSRRLVEKLAQELEGLQKLIVETVAILGKRGEESKMQSSRLIELEKAYLKENEELEQSRTRREDLENNLAQKRTALSILEKKRHRLEVVLAEDASQRKGLEEELLERHHLTLEMLLSCETALEIEVDEAEKQVRRLRISIDRIGAVNMAAIEEYESQAKRFQEIDSQLVDLNEAKKDLEKIIRKLDAECRKVFKETFEQIRKNFRKNFSVLFSGGEANLTFTESPDVLEAGVEIVAKPPGKQMRSISLLSGGEKCLTALALLFSIFEVRPAPFCVLDEVDAPLDDSNIDRFTDVLKQYIEKTQFIVVTHNKKTMAIADLLLGVSMEEKGVSKLISLAFKKAALAEKI